MDRVRFEDSLGNHKRTVKATSVPKAIDQLPDGRLPYGWLAIPEFASIGPHSDTALIVALEAENEALKSERRLMAQRYFGAGFSIGYGGADITETPKHFDRVWNRLENKSQELNK